MVPTDPPAGGELFECQICMDDQPITTKLTCTNCENAICKSCDEKWKKQEDMAKRAECPFGCGHTNSYEEMKQWQSCDYRMVLWDKWLMENVPCWKRQWKCVVICPVSIILTVFAMLTGFIVMMKLR